jgi:hypothetical protein
MRRADLHQRGADSPQSRRASASKVSVLQELLRQQIPIIATLLAAGFVSAYLQHGYLPGGDRPFPLAGVRVPIWHLIWMGMWTGYITALVGQAAGIFALPYSTSVLQFDNPHVTPTMLVLTLFNPIGALLGFRRGGNGILILPRPSALEDSPAVLSVRFSAPQFWPIPTPFVRPWVRRSSYSVCN